MLSGDLIKKLSAMNLIKILLRDDFLRRVGELHDEFIKRFGKYRKISVSSFRSYITKLPYIGIKNKYRLYGSVKAIKRAERDCIKIGEDYIVDYRENR